MSNLNMTYFKSEDIRIFPCAYRGFKPAESTEALNAAPVVWNADASLTTEYNLTHMFSHLLGQHSFIVSSPEKTNDADFKCVINGYYFEIDRDAFCRAYNEALAPASGWLDTLRGEREGCLCIRVLPKFETSAAGETSEPKIANFNLTSLVTMELTQTSEGYLLDVESAIESGKVTEFTGLAFYPVANSIQNLAATLTDGSVLYSLPLNDESLYAETVYQEIKEKIIEGVKAVNWSKHLEVAPLKVGTDNAIDLNSYAGIHNLHTFFVGDLKTLCNNNTIDNKVLTEMYNFPPALGNPSIFKIEDGEDRPDLFLALEVFDPGIGSESSPKTSPVVQILHTFGYSKAKIAVGYTAQTTNRMNTYGSMIETEEGSCYYTKEFDSDCCTFIRYGHRGSSASGAVITWDSWEGLSEEELKLFACLRAVEAEQRLADDLILGNTVPRFAKRLMANPQTGAIPADLNPGWYYYVQSSISALAFLGGADKLDSTVSWEQKQLLNAPYSYTALLEVIGEDEASGPRMQRVSIFNSFNEVIASCSRAIADTPKKWTFDITSANIRDQFVALAEKQKAHQISTYDELKKLIKTLYESSSRDDQVARSGLQVELQFTHSFVNLLVPSSISGYSFHIAPGTIGHLATSWTPKGAFHISLVLHKLQKFDSATPKSTDINFSQTLSAELMVSAGQKLDSALGSLLWTVRYPTNIQNPIPLNSYDDLVNLQVQLLTEMPFGEHDAPAENNLSVPVVITGSNVTIKGYNIPIGSAGYLAALADQTYQGKSYPFTFLLSLLTPENENWNKSCFIARQDSKGIWEISSGYVDRAAKADYATEAGSVAGEAVSGAVMYASDASHAQYAVEAEHASFADGVLAEGIQGTVECASRLELDAAYASYAEDTDTGIGDGLLGSRVVTNVVEPGLYLVEVVIRAALGLNAFRESTFFFFPEYSDKPAPKTQQIICNGIVVLETTPYYQDWKSTSLFTGAKFVAQALESWSGSISNDLAIKVWQIAGVSGKANGPFQNK